VEHILYFRCSRVNEGNHDVASALENAESFVLMRQLARVHDQVTELGVADGAVVAREAAAPSLVVFEGSVERNVDGVGGRVMVRLQLPLLVWLVSDHEVHGRIWRVVVVSCENFRLEGLNIEPKEL